MYRTLSDISPVHCNIPKFFVSNNLWLNKSLHLSKYLLLSNYILILIRSFLLLPHCSLHGLWWPPCYLSFYKNQCFRCQIWIRSYGAHLSVSGLVYLKCSYTAFLILSQVTVPILCMLQWTESTDINIFACYSEQRVNIWSSFHANWEPVVRMLDPLAVLPWIFRKFHRDSHVSIFLIYKPTRGIVGIRFPHILTHNIYLEWFYWI